VFLRNERRSAFPRAARIVPVNRPLQPIVHSHSAFTHRCNYTQGIAMEHARNALIASVSAIWLLLLTGVAGATSISYQISGTSSGTLGGTAFTNALVTVTLSSDTANVVAVPSLSSNVVANTGTTTVDIAGIGTATVTDATAILASVTPIAVPGVLPLQSYVIIATLDHPPSLDQGITAIGLIGGDALTGYDLRTASASISAQGGVGHSTDVIHTTRGNLTFSIDVTPFRQVTFAANGPPGVTPISPTNGLWWNPAESGTGYAMDVRHGTLVMTVYSYLPNGSPLWYLAVGQIVDNTVTATLDKYANGQCISCAYRPAQIQGNDGTVTVTFTSPTKGTMTLPGRGAFPIELQPF
jgi:hypothetical protein